MSLRNALLMPAIVFVVAVSASAQTSVSGTVVGTVTDPTGALVPKAEVTLLNMDTNASQSQITNEAGGYVFPNVTPGSYKLT
ncbi:MAG TPA: carboxypeptidase-like regulatory domain-containing protein, partial [Bryobacteraceae bacterium]